MDIPYLFYPLAGEDFDGGAGHVDVVVVGPLDLQRPARQVDCRGHWGQRPFGPGASLVGPIILLILPPDDRRRGQDGQPLGSAMYLTQCLACVRRADSG